MNVYVNVYNLIISNPNVVKYQTKTFDVHKTDGKDGNISIIVVFLGEWQSWLSSMITHSV